MNIPFKNIDSPKLIVAFRLIESGNTHLIIHSENSIYLKAVGKHFWFPQYISIPLKENHSNGMCIIWGLKGKIRVDIDSLPEKQVKKQIPTILIQQKITPITSKLVEFQIRASLLNKSIFNGVSDKLKNPKVKPINVPNFDIHYTPQNISI